MTKPTRRKLMALGAASAMAVPQQLGANRRSPSFIAMVRQPAFESANNQPQGVIEFPITYGALGIIELSSEVTFDHIPSQKELTEEIKTKMISELQARNIIIGDRDIVVYSGAFF